MFNSFLCKMLLLLKQVSDFAENSEAFTFRRTLQRILLEKRNNLIEDILVSTDSVTITLRVVRAPFLLEIDRSTIQSFSHFFEQFPVFLLHFQMKVHLNPVPCSIG